jgi:hypothetical protein
VQVLAHPLAPQGDGVLQVGDHEQHVGPAGRGLSDHGGRVEVAWVVA